MSEPPAPVTPPLAGHVTCDVLVIGAGIAGTSLAWALRQAAPDTRVIVLERESQPGYHSTGRSVAQFILSYGPPQVRALSRACLAVLQAPPPGFAEGPLLHRRATLTVAYEDEDRARALAGLDEAWGVLQSFSQTGERLDADAACAMVPALRREGLLGAVHEPESWDIDVHALHQAFLRGMKRDTPRGMHPGGSVLVCDAPLSVLARRGGVWQAQAGGRRFEAPVVANAAGAWCDEVAALAATDGVRPIGLQPLRRSAFSFAAPAGLDVRHWPLVIDAGHGWYFKPDAGQLIGSPANEDPTPPQDVQPEELDIALGADRIERHTTMTVRPQRRWAGLRSFVPDGDLVGGWDAQAEGFFWCAAQGGYGIQTSAAMGQACAGLLLQRELPASLRALGLTAESLSPARRQGQRGTPG